MRTSVMTVLLWYHWDALEYKILSGILRTAGAEYIHDYRDKNIDFPEKLYKKREKYYKKICEIQINNSVINNVSI
jgi:hypothetical protein